jgi:MSHA pilin protein MshC
MLSTLKRNPGGFTFLEVIIVLALIGLLAAVVVARRHASNTSLPARSQILKAHLRYAQSRAMNNDTSWGIRFSGDGYHLFNSDDPGTDLPLPGEDGGSVNLADYNLSVGGTEIVSFDTWGRPCMDTGATNLNPSDRTLTLADADGNTRSITIVKNTGYIP